MIPDLFAALVHSIVGQQIATKAHETDLAEDDGCVRGDLSRKGARPLARGVAGVRNHVQEGGLHPVGGTENRIGRVRHPFIADDERCRGLRQVVGTGRYRRMDSGNADAPFAARPDVLSFGDLAVQRGLRMLYHHRKITRPLFEKYRRRYSPYGSVACIYLWAVSAGAVEGLKDYAPKSKNNVRI